MITIRTPRALSTRELNRVTLHRQLLHERAELSVTDAVEHLAGLQSQLPSPPYIGLWTRLRRFDRDELTALMHQRRIVRSTMMRYTLHLVSAADFVWLRPTVQPVMERAQRGFFGRRTGGMDLTELVDAARVVLTPGALTQVQLRAQLGSRFPDRDALALAYSAQYLLPMVHVPPGGTWGTSGSVPSALASTWLDTPLAGERDVSRMVKRYLAAFGPASLMDIQAWSGLTRMGEFLDPIRGQLRVMRDEAGRELFDLPDGQWAEPDESMPVRFLPEYDNLAVAYADRSRVMTEPQRKAISSGAGGRTETRSGQKGAVAATVLVDGFVRATWKLRRTGKRTELLVEPFSALSPAEHDAVEQEGAALLAFAADPGGDQVVRFV